MTAAEGGRNGLRREELNEQEFDFLRRLIYDYAGIVIADNKRSMVQGRISRRMRELGVRDVGEYIDYVRSAPEIERDGLASVLTTNVTAFFREPHHFDYLRSEFIPAWLARQFGRPRFRAWSAGCSSGEEPYSIGITVLEALAKLPGADVRILATDLDSAMVRAARDGIYHLSRSSGLGEAMLKKWFMRGAGAQSGLIRVRSQLRDAVRVMPLNLLEAWPMKSQFDVIFCRNVFIYFDKAVKVRILSGFADRLQPGGLLFIGHSETLHGLSDQFELLGQTIYRKRPRTCARRSLACGLVISVISLTRPVASAAYA